MEQILLLKFIIIFACVYPSYGFRVSFINGSEYEVEVVINDNNEWSTVCDNTKNLNEVKITCRKGGSFESANDANGGAYHRQEDNDTICFDYASFDGKEFALEQYSQSESENDYRTHDQAAGASSHNTDYTASNKIPQFSCYIEDIQLNPDILKKKNYMLKLHQLKESLNAIGKPPVKSV